jgi:NACHT domain-containing protein
MSTQDKASRQSLGGAADELGGAHRAGVGAYLIIHGLCGLAVPGLFDDAAGRPVLVVAESDSPPEDLECRFSGGPTAWLQCKHSLEWNATFVKVVATWIDAMRMGEVAADDRLAVAVARLSRPLHELAEALDRRRRPHPSAPSPGERRQLDRFRALLRERGVSDEVEAEAIMGRAALLVIDAVDGASPHSQISRALLEGTVVHAGDGQRAVGILRAEVRRHARQRTGDQLGGWVAALRRGGVRLVEDPEGALGARRAARDAAVNGYRDRLVARAGELPLSTMGFDLPPLQAGDLADGLRVRWASPSQPRRSGGRSPVKLLVAVRRLGRCLLRGLPGGGKSLALTQIAGAWSGDDTAPLPLLVNLRELAEQVRAGRLVLTDDRMVQLGVEALGEPDGSLVAEEVHERLASGRVLLLLDGLDECRRQRHEVADALRTWIATLQADVDVVVSSRDSAYASARLLELAELELETPSDLQATLRALLRHVADRMIGTAGREAWLAERTASLDTAQQTDTALWRIPLFAVLLTLLVAERPPRELPHTRARILHAVITDVVRRWESRVRADGRLVIAGLDPASAERCLLDCYAIIANQLFDALGEAPAPPVVAAVAQALTTAWAQPAGRANVAAEQVLELWDEAGVFVAQHPGTITPRTRVFLEVGEALHVASLPPAEQLGWLDEQLGDGDRHETVILAAGLSRHLADALIHRAASDPSLTRLAVWVVRDGATVAAEPITELVEALLGRLTTTGTGLERWQVASDLCRLPVPADRQDAVLEAISVHLGADRARLGRAIAILTWNLEGEEADRALVELLESPPVRRLPQRRSDAAPPAKAARRFGVPATNILVDVDYSRAVEAAATRLLPDHPELAPTVVRATREVGMEASFALRSLLARYGHDVPPVFDEAMHEDLARTTRIITAAWRTWMELIRARAAPADLRPGQAWHLGGLADLVATFNLDQVNFTALPEAVNQERELLAELTALVAVVSGLDPAVLATQADIVLATDQGERDMISLLSYGGTDLDTPDWARVEDRDAARALLLRALGCKSDWLRELAAWYLNTLPDRPQTARGLEGLLPSLDGPHRYLAAEVLLDLIPEAELEGRLSTYAGSDDSMLRAAAAQHAAADVARGRADLADLEPYCRDPDLGVRHAITTTLNVRKLDQPDQDRLGTWLQEPTQRWTCLRCGTEQAPSDQQCKRCRYPADPSGVSAQFD